MRYCPLWTVFPVPVGPQVRTRWPLRISRSSKNVLRARFVVGTMTLATALRTTAVRTERVGGTGGCQVKCWGLFWLLCAGSNSCRKLRAPID